MVQNKTKPNPGQKRKKVKYASIQVCDQCSVVKAKTKIYPSKTGFHPHASDDNHTKHEGNRSEVKGSHLIPLIVCMF